MSERIRSASRLPADWLMITLAYAMFVALGLGTALLGMAWPSMQTEFGVQLSDQGLLLIAMMLGYLIASFASGTMSARLGIGRLLVIGLLISAACLFAIFFVRSWPLLILASLFNSLGRGSVDAGMNAYMAQRYNARVMNWLHASAGVGVTITPLIMTAVFSAQLSWRYGYLVVGIFTVLVMVLSFIARFRWSLVDGTSRGASDDAARTARRVPLGVTLSLPILWLAMGTAFFYSGSEGTPGNWIFTLFTQSRGVPEVEAAQWVSVYWGVFTFGRIFFGLVISRVNLSVLLRACMVAALVGTGLLWWHPLLWISYAGLALLGFVLAPILPVLISNLPRWVGPQHAANAIGVQIAVAGTGFTMIPALAGVIANRSSLEAIPPVLFASLFLLLALYQVSELVVGQKRKRVPAAVSVS
jgi:fucose permease